MPRRKVPEACIICDCTPCECNAKKTVRKAAAVREVTVEKSPVRERLAPPRHAVSEEDLVLANAIRILAAAEILHPTEMAKYASILSSWKNSDRATAWRARREAMT